MATQEQIDQILELMEQTQAGSFFDHVDHTQVGIGAVMRILRQAEHPVTAGAIAQIMGVSTARVTVLLKKLEVKGLIVRERDWLDARVTNVCLTEQGVQADDAIRAQIAQKVGAVIDAVGMERMLEFSAIAREIGQALRENAEK